MKPQIVLMIPLGEAPPGMAGRPDNTLPGQPAYPDNTLPPGGQPPTAGWPQPPQVWPQPPGQGPARPDAGLPDVPPGINRPPGSGEHPIFIPGTPENPIALPPGTIWPPIHPPGGEAGGEADKMVVMAWIPQQGYRYVVVDLGLRPDAGLPEQPQPPHRPDNTLPPTAQPRQGGRR